MELSFLNWAAGVKTSDSDCRCKRILTSIKYVGSVKRSVRSLMLPAALVSEITLKI